MLSISVIIPTRNNAGTIGPLVSSAVQQSPPPLEVLVVDGSSIDGTGSIAADMGAKVTVYVPQ